MKSTSRFARRPSGFSLVELMITMALGLALTAAMAGVFVASKGGFRRQDQLASIQQSVRTAFEYLTNDARIAGLMGCQTRSDSSSAANLLSATDLRTNLLVGVEGYNAAAAPSYPLTDSTTATDWSNNTSTGRAEAAIPLATLGGSLTPGSDVLVLRTVVGGPVRLTANTASNTSELSIESLSGGTCSGGAAKVSGFCPGSYGLIASCMNARVFAVNAVAASPTKLTLTSAIGAPIYGMSTAEVFPLQTIVYYVKTPSGASAPSLYRRIINGDINEEQELIEGVESMQVTYGVDTTSPDPDGILDGTSYLTSTNVVDWNQVAAVRVSLLIRSMTQVGSDIAKASAPVNGVSVTFPTTSPHYDRRVFTTTVAVRNKIAF